MKKWIALGSIVLALESARMPGGSEKTNFRRSFFSEKNIVKNDSAFLDESRNRGANPITPRFSSGHTIVLLSF